MSALDGLLDKLAGVKKQGAGFVACCPAHDDDHQSLSVTTGDDDRVLVNCHAGCDFDSIVGSVGLTPSDLFAPRTSCERDRLVAEYDYRDESGGLLYVVERRDPKRFLQKKPAEQGGWDYKLNGVRRVPYRLAEVLEAVTAHRWILVVEGEKDVHTLVGQGFVATCNAGGAGKWRREWSAMFRGAKVAVIPDNDEAGRKHAEQVAGSLAAVAADLRIVDMRGLEDHGDVSDWLAMGHDGAELRDLILNAPFWGSEPKSGLAPVREAGARPLDALLDATVALIRRYVVLKPIQLHAVVLWIAHAHAIEAFFTTGRLFLRSPEPECGKSLLFDVMETLVPADPILDVSISPAALYRSLGGASPPVVMLDEIDKTIGRKGAGDSESSSLLLAVVNGGYRRGRSVRRCVGKDHDIKKFPIFAPVAFAGISPKLDRAALTRSIVIEMQRRAPDELVDEYVAWDAVPAGEALRDELAAWATAHVDWLRGARPDRPAGIVNRRAECWVPLLAVADAAGGEWPQRGRDAATALCGVGQDQGQVSVGQRLLTDLEIIFGDGEAMWSADLLAALNAADEAPWARWNEGAGITAHDLATQLRRFGVHRSEDIKLGGRNRKGYRRQWFAEAWKRYCAAEVVPGSLVREVQ